jgi:SAM-dependent methyltransferase
MSNVDTETVRGFGDEWSRFDQSALTKRELQILFDRYFKIFPWPDLPQGAVGFDAGCGSGRWAQFILPQIGLLHCIDASERALAVAQRNLSIFKNVVFHLAPIGDIPISKSSMDFGYSLGVLHHIPDTEAALKACVDLLKPNAPFLVYLYYAFDNRPTWFRVIWQISDYGRRAISCSPMWLRYVLSQICAAIVYYPLARLSLFLERTGINVTPIPLSSYRGQSFYTMRTDALDRFGTRLEQRFSREAIRLMMERAGLHQIVFSESVPYWCAVGRKK